MLQSLLALLLLLASAPLSGRAAPLAAQARSLTIESFDAEIAVRSSGDVDVKEVLRVRFDGEWNGLRRVLPEAYRTPAGFNYRLLLDVEGAADAQGRPLRVEERRDGGDRELRIWVPDARDAVRTVVLRYRVRNALRFFGQHDELYWNVTGTEWEIPIEAAYATILLPAGVQGVEAGAYTGATGSTERAARLDVEGERVRVMSTRPFSPGEGLTVAVRWAPGVVARPTAFERARLFARMNGFNLLAGLLPLGVLAAMLSLWLRRGRDPKPQSIAPHYEPPDAMSPAELGALVDHTADLPDITATLVDLAVRGWLVIEQTEEKKLLGLKIETEYAFRLRRPSVEWGALEPHERRLLAAVFGPAAPAGEHVTLASLKDEFHSKLAGIRDAIYARLIERGYYCQRPDRVRSRYVAAGVVLGAVLIWGGIAAAEHVALSPVAAIVAGVLAALIVVGIGWVMPARTEAGARARERGLGFRDFLDRVESDRFRRMITGPEMFERYLPYAMALGVEERWARAFAGIYREPPRWYSGSNGGTFHVSGFTHDLSRMSARAGAVMASTPRSSGGSGFSGGSSGGGFGGGGGGGF
jgi:hypothetical protein